MERIEINSLSEKDVNKEITLKGWIDTIREHGKLIFFDLRNLSGKIQSVIFIKNSDFEKAKQLTRESCVEFTGKIGLRPKGTENSEIPTGKIELQIEKLKILNLCPALPFDIENKDTNEEIRLKYRYLDLRSPNMQRNLLVRSKVMKIMRDFMYENGFNEFETPFLAKSTPEGARDYVVPSRTQPGKFFALPQSPQLFKQLLMVAGFEKYFQIVRCMRDEDLRSDRQPEFTQLDIEMSFTSQEEIITLIEKLLKRIWKEVLNVDIKIPFKRITYDEAMKKYGNDKPDLRAETKERFAFEWVIDFPLFDYSKEEKKYVSTHHPFTHPEMSSFEKNPKTAKAVAYDIVLNGVEIGGGSIRIHESDIQEKVFEVLDLTKKEQQEKFGFLLDALRFGAPPHGGIALGFDRLMQLILEVESIREVIPFPKNKEAKDLMLDAPSEISEKQLKEIHIKLDVPKKAKK